MVTTKALPSLAQVKLEFLKLYSPVLEFGLAAVAAMDLIETTPARKVAYCVIGLVVQAQDGTAEAGVSQAQEAWDTWVVAGRLHLDL